MNHFDAQRKLNDVITEHWHTVDDACRALNDIAQAGHDLGLDRMSARIDSLCKALADSKRELRTAYGEMVGSFSEAA